MGERKNFGDLRNIVDFIQRQSSAFPRLEIFIEHLVTANMEIPYLWRNVFKMLGLIYVNSLILFCILNFFDEVVPVPFVCSEIALRHFPQEVSLRKFVSEF